MNDSNSDKIGSVDLSGLFCPVCDYSLTGLPEPRCPECGSSFDAEEQRRKQGDVAVPVGDCLGGQKRRRSIGAILGVLVAFLSGPARFSRSLPKRCEWSTPLRYGLLTRGVTACLGAGYAIVHNDPYGFLAVLMVLSFSLVFDLCLALLFHLCCQTRPAYAFAGWGEWFWSLQYCSIFLVIGFLMSIPFQELEFASLGNDAMWARPVYILAMTLMLPALAGIAWWIYLVRLVWARCRGVYSLLIAIASVPFGIIMTPVIIGILISHFTPYW